MDNRIKDRAAIVISKLTKIRIISRTTTRTRTIRTIIKTKARINRIMRTPNRIT